MSTIPNTAPAELGSRFWLTRRVVIVTLIVALAAAALTLTIVLVTSDSSGNDSSGTPAHAVPAAPQGHYFGGPGEGAPDMRGPSPSESPSAPATDGGDQLGGARP